MLLAFDPSSSQIVVALVGGGFLALTATITGCFNMRANQRTSVAVTDHIETEGPTVEHIATTLERMDAKLDEVLTWQGRHEALHVRQDANQH